MRIESIRIRNFRSYLDETIPFDAYVCVVGPNGAGKSNILTALNAFFRYSPDGESDYSTLDKEDFHQKNTRNPIIITATFVDLSEEAKSDFASYYRQKKLVISAIAIWDEGTQTAPVIQYGERMIMKPFARFFQAEGNRGKVEELRVIYEQIRRDYSVLPDEKTKSVMFDALRKYEEDHPGECSLEQSADQFYGFGAKGKNLLEKHVQWVFVPAVKDATTEGTEEKRTAIGQLLARTVRAKVSFDSEIDALRKEALAKYKEVLKAHEKVLTDLSDTLSARLRDWAHQDARVNLSWQGDESKVEISDPVAEVLAAEGAFEGHLARFGHGLQRSFLLALLNELASSARGAGPDLVLACEEPELYQHPPQIRHFASVFYELARKGTQVLVCTHSPIFVRGNQFEEVRYVTKNRRTEMSNVKWLTFDAVADAIAKAGGTRPLKPAGTALKVAQALQPTVNEMFFARNLVLVEGLEDAAYIYVYLVLTDRWQEFRRLGGHIVHCQGKNSMILPLAIALGLGIPTFVVFDADTDDCAKADRRTQHEMDNRTLLSLCGRGQENPMPDKTLWKNDMVMWKESIGAELRQEIGGDLFEQFVCEVKKKLGVVEVPKLGKNASFIQHFLSYMWDSGTKCATLDRLSHMIMQFTKADPAPTGS
jgi:putative ATP-dependent endonuclease of OLD family